MTVVINGTTGIDTPAIETDSLVIPTQVVNGITVGKGGGSVAQNTALGSSALITNTSGAYSTAIGYEAGKLNTTGEITAIGALALQKNTTAFYNTGVGVAALYNNTTGASNTAIGRDALISNTTASGSTAVGYQAGYSNTTGAGNVAVGISAGYTNTTGRYNTFVGSGAGYSSTGSGNTFIGTYGSNGSVGCGYYMTTGSDNVIVGGFTGQGSGLDIRTANNYIVLSDGLGNPRLVADSNGAVYAPNGFGVTYGTEFNCASNLNAGTGEFWINWRGSTTTITEYRFMNGKNVGAYAALRATAFNVSSDYRLKENIVDLTGAVDRLMLLKPKRFNFIEGNKVGYDSSKTVDGFLAHEVSQAVPEAVTGEKDAEIDERGSGYQSLDQSKLVPLLVAAVQELKAQLDESNLILTSVKTELDTVKTELATLKGAV